MDELEQLMLGPGIESVIQFDRHVATLLADGESDVSLSLSHEERLKVMRLLVRLFGRYQIEKGDWATLAITLAFKHEPVFRSKVKVQKKATKPLAWHPPRQLKLWLDVQKLKIERPGMSLEHCIGILKKQPEWEVYSLTRARYYESRKSPLVEFAMKLKESLAPTDFWAAVGIDFQKLLDDVDGMRDRNQ